MSIVTYNQVTLPYPFMTQFSQEPVFDEKSNTDWWVTRYSIGVKCVLNTQYLKVNTINGLMTSPAQIMNTVREMLEKPRKRLSYQINGVEMIPQAQNGLSGTVDAYNGPQCKRCNITQMSDNTFLLDYLIIAHYWQNSYANGTAQNQIAGNVLFNRWTETVEMDELMLSRRTRTGYFRIRSDNADGIIPDNLRNQMAVLSIPVGFLRESSRFEQDMDGLTMNYSIVDKEVYKLPPYLPGPPDIFGNQQAAFRAEGYYEDVVTGLYIPTFRVGRVVLKLWGSAATSQDQLLYAAATIASIKMAANKGQPLKGSASILINGEPLWTSWRFHVDMYQNMVEVQVEAYLNLTAERFVSFAGFAGEPRVFTPGSDTSLPGAVGLNTPPPYMSRGSASLLVQAASYYDPNALNASLIAANDTSPGDNNLIPADADLLGIFSPTYQMPGLQPGQAGVIPEP